MKKDQEDKEDGGIPVYEDRKKQWINDEKVKKELADIYANVQKGFDDKADQNAVIERAYDVYNCELNENQMYDGDSKVYLPITHDAVEARVTRFSNMIFPPTGRYSEVLSSDGLVPYETMAILDHYVEQTGLRDVIVPALLRSGDITGQYSLFLSWSNRVRHATKKVQTPLIHSDEGDVADAGTTEDIEIEEVDDSRPDVSVLDARDLLVLPASVDEIEDADVVSVALRMSKTKVREMIDSGEFDEDAGETLLDNFGTNPKDSQPDPDKKNLNAAGVKVDSSGSKTALVYMVFAKLKIGGERRRCVAYLAGPDLILSCKRNPYWSDRIPVISQAALKLSGSFWGKSRVETVEKSQYAANDAFNMGQDSIKYSLMPVTVIDPEKFAKASSVVLTMGAIWLGDPEAIEIKQFPNQSQWASAVVSDCRNQIMQSLSVNPAMIPMGGAGKKPTQAQIAQEQQVALESTADVVTILETSILNKLLRWFYEMDYQFRTKDVIVRRFGPLGLQAQMQAIPPVGVDTHYTFKWYGTEGTRSAQQIQQMISMLNVLKGMPPEMLGGRKLDAGPIIEQAANVTFGPKVAPKVLIDQRHLLTVDPEQEDQMLIMGFQASVHPMDNDPEHMKTHIEAAQMTGDPNGLIRIHIQAHMDQLKQKQAQMQPQQQAPQQGGPRPGGQVQPPTGPQQPAGAVRPDAMQGAMPRDRNPQ